MNWSTVRGALGPGPAPKPELSKARMSSSLWSNRSARPADVQEIGAVRPTQSTASIDRCYAVAYRILRDMHLAQDATQQAMLSAWRDLPTLRDPVAPTKGGAGRPPWLRRQTIANRGCEVHPGRVPPVQGQPVASAAAR